MRQGLFDPLLGDLVDHHPVDRLLRPPGCDLLGDMPRDGFPLAVGVGSQVDDIRLLGRLFQLLEHLPLPPNHVVPGLELVFDVDPQFALGQVLDVPHAGLDEEVLAQVSLEGARLGRALHDQ